MDKDASIKLSVGLFPNSRPAPQGLYWICSGPPPLAILTIIRVLETIDPPLSKATEEPPTLSGNWNLSHLWETCFYHQSLEWRPRRAFVSGALRRLFSRPPTDNE